VNQAVEGEDGPTNHRNAFVGMFRPGVGSRLLGLIGRCCSRDSVRWDLDNPELSKWVNQGNHLLRLPWRRAGFSSVKLEITGRLEPKLEA